MLLDGRDVSEAIRAPEVSEAASRVAADPGVREALVAKQRALIAGGDWVAEGRDIGTVVAPDAELKVFLTAVPRGARAPARRRARRRRRRRCSPSRRCATSATPRASTARSRAAPGAVALDTTGLTVEEVVERIAALAQRRRACGLRSDRTPEPRPPGHTGRC